MPYKIDEIEGIGPAMSEKLGIAEIKTTADLLEKCCDAKGRKAVSNETGCSEKQLLKWVNMADLMRISGVGEEYSELLEVAGVDTVRELRRRNAENLTAAMKQTNEEKKLTRATPSEIIVQKWIEQAKELEPMITH